MSPSIVEKFYVQYIFNINQVVIQSSLVKMTAVAIASNVQRNSCIWLKKKRSEIGKINIAIQGRDLCF